ncbi:MAG: AP2 domain-containing protein [Oscillospiraceae bacterium]|nr:AP2 domain-containing protein [Oscillospiraceae bacterium]
MKRINIEGMKFGRLTVIMPVPTQRRKCNGKLCNEVKWLCSCECGMTTMVSGTDLRSGRTQSCGCLLSEKSRERATKHGGSGERLYTIWCAMKQRCSYDGYQHKENYSMKGIKVCDEWVNDYEAFRKWSYENGFFEQPKGTPHREILSIDRINPNRGYSPDNCQWISCDSNLRKRFDDARGGGVGECFDDKSSK